MEFTISIANTSILIQSIHSSSYNTCKDYLITANEKPDIVIRIDEAMIRDEQLRAQQSSEIAQSPKALERVLVQRKVTESLLFRNILLMHGAVIAVNRVSYMFTGKSGTGKTTHINKWLENAQDSFVVNGDKPFIIIKPEGVFACGTPWCGKENMGKNTIVPLESIIFMERSDKNHIEPVAFKTAFPNLLEQTYRPGNSDMMKKTLELLFNLKDRIRFYKFYFDNFKMDAFYTSFNALTRQK